MAEDTTVVDSDPTLSPGIVEEGARDSGITDKSGSVDAASEQESGAEDTKEKEGSEDKDAGKTNKRVKDTESALKTAQQEFHAERDRMKVELAELRGELQTVKTLREDLAVSAKEEKDEPDFLDDKEWDSLFEENPGKAMRQMVRLQRQEIASLLQDRDEAIRDERRKMIEEATSPERAKLQDTITDLKKKDWFKKLDYKTQLGIAAEVTEAKPKKERTTVEPSKTGPAGTGKSIATSKETERERRVKAAEATAKQIWPDEGEKKPGVIGIEEEKGVFK